MRILRVGALVAGLALILLWASGRLDRPLDFLDRFGSPHERYAAMLERTGLDGTALGQDWLAAARAALENPVPVATPFLETGYLPPEEVMAVGYRVEVPRGRRLAIDIQYETGRPGRLFLDLFRTDGEALDRVASLEYPGERAFLVEVTRDSTYVLRVQPELLRGGRYTVTQRTLASLPFPIPGESAAAIRSGFGAARDAGVRTHEGVDIFAPRGTPVVAVTGGLARTGTNPRGGNVVRLHDPGAGRTFYYAHLDRWAFEGTARVGAGEVLGFVGNTGNARTTPPHLHFGIYAGEAIDPLPFLRPDDPVPPLPADAGVLDTMVRVAGSGASALRGPDEPAGRGVALERGTLAHVFGLTASWLRVRLPDGSSGYVSPARVTPVDRPARDAM